jgi:EAL domain-containing protein (putative c-di-GMP-specific phosphodiesterase class I)
VLKIDQCFVAGLPSDTYDVAIVRAVIAISQALNLSVVAEGVESPEQAEALLHFGCHEVQGYHFYRPLTAGAFEAEVILSRPNRPTSSSNRPARTRSARPVG